MDEPTLTRLRASLDNMFMVRGAALRLRFFTADDLRDFSANQPSDRAYIMYVADSIERHNVATVGELWARLEALYHDDADDDEEPCPRCNFEWAVRDVVQWGAYVEEQHSGEYALNDLEVRLLALCREWDVDDTIRRCNDD